MMPSEIQKTVDDIRKRYYFRRFGNKPEANADGGKGSGNFGHGGRPGKIGGSAPEGGSAERVTSGNGSKKFQNVSRKVFADAIVKAKKNVDPRKAWRVDVHTKEQLYKDYKQAKLHMSEGGSTVAVTASGDIVSVCKKNGDTIKGKELMKLAVENGGKKLDSYSGNHDFYTKCGFEPVSWCGFSEEYAPDGWEKGKDKWEPVIFYKYTGKVSTEKAADFMKRVPRSKDYDTAQAKRDSEV